MNFGKVKGLEIRNRLEDCFQSDLDLINLEENTLNILVVTNFQLFPNPVKERFEVKAVFKKKQNISLQLINSLGQNLLRQDLGTIQQLEERIKVSSFPDGSYILVLLFERGDRVAYKIIKNNIK